MKAPGLRSAAAALISASNPSPLTDQGIPMTAVYMIVAFIAVFAILNVLATGRLD
jgi:hypothetical protein